jgi:ABC-type sulfate/molybdate transport systems ATPase subunit
MIRSRVTVSLKLMQLEPLEQPVSEPALRWTAAAGRAGAGAGCGAQGATAGRTIRGVGRQGPEGAAQVASAAARRNPHHEVFVTHDQEEALEVADEVVIMNQARVEQVGSPQHVYDHPASPFVYQFLGNVNRIRLPIRGLDGAGDITRSDDGTIAYVRPHDIELHRFHDGMPGEVAVIRSLHTAGSVARVVCARGIDEELIEAELPRQYLESLGVAVRDTVLLRLRRSRTFADDYAI